MARVTYHALADVLNITYLDQKFVEFVRNAIWVKFTAIDIIPTGTIDPSATKNEKLLSGLVIRDSGGPAGFRLPATLRYS